MSGRTRVTRELPHMNPELLQEKQDYLTKLEIYISELEEDLQKARKQRAKLRIQMAVFQATEYNPFNQLPDKVLRHIFSYDISDNHIAIGRLLLVCKRWKRTILDDYRLWSRIQISIPHLDSYWGRTLYATACMARSRDSLLDVEIDFSRPISDRQGMKQDIVAYVKRNVPPIRHGVVDQWAKELDCPFIPDSCINYQRQAVSLVDHLVGSTGENIRRWRSLSLRLPQDDAEFCADVWISLSRRTPNLLKLSLECCRNTLDRLEDKSSRGLPDLTALQDLTLHGGMTISQFGVWNNVVTYLDLEVDNSTHVMSQVVYFPRLRTLRLHGLACADAGMSLDHIIYLPHLTHLLLSGHYDSLADLNLDFPCLEDLHIRTDHIPVSEPPHVKPIRLHWTIPPESDVSWSDSSLQRAFRSLLRPFETVQGVTVPLIAKQSVRSAAADMRRKGVLPLALTRVTASGEKSIDGRYSSLSP
jgi:hypothetical protein